MPYPNEHAARLKDPNGFDRIRRQNDKFGTGIHAIFGVKDGKLTLQAIRFDSDKFTAAQAKAWLKDHGHTAAKFEAATGKHREPITFRADIAKVDEELRMVWGWAYVCEEDGQKIVDYSGEVMTWQELQKCAHSFSGYGGVMHRTKGGELVDRIMFSPHVQKALGIEVPIGWFVGYRVDDDDAWQGVLDGTYTGFSIHGTALKRELTDEEAEIFA